MQNENFWKLDNEHYALYTESKEVMKRIKRYYPDFAQMGEYYNSKGKLKGKQYRVPIKRKRSALRLSKIA
ncbi:hypothetical protein [Sutcliffiella sp. NC1]|uniref:hypothetical protein n=1 Tax=Sutcliffiella sp. NC1 TaxID=3004096 RepID=UPI0022DD174F|nr:hypothetical protein [Sutcliffiella sp. NC1]WBL16381.1 hypothetical protein O1A01_07040 [Sutcliffiella sp. NC1]